MIKQRAANQLITLDSMGAPRNGKRSLIRLRTVHRAASIGLLKNSIWKSNRHHNADTPQLRSDAEKGISVMNNTSAVIKALPSQPAFRSREGRRSGPMLLMLIRRISVTRFRGSLGREPFWLSLFCSVSLSLSLLLPLMRAFAPCPRHVYVYICLVSFAVTSD